MKNDRTEQKVKLHKTSTEAEVLVHAPTYVMAMYVYTLPDPSP